MNLLNHKKDFVIEAEWQFFATSHGKGACDGIGGCVKRNAYRASLQNRNSKKKQILQNCTSGQLNFSIKFILISAQLKNSKITKKIGISICNSENRKKYTGLSLLQTN